MLDDLTNQTKDLESKLNEQIEKNVNLSKEVSDLHKRELIAEVSEFNRYRNREVYLYN